MVDYIFSTGPNFLLAGRTKGDRHIDWAHLSKVSNLDVAY